MYLLDTNVVSESYKPRPHGAVIGWLRTTAPAAIFIPSIVIGELQRGAERARLGNPQKAVDIEHWVDMLVGGHQILPLCADSAREWVRLLPGRTDAHIEDAMIAAIARVRGLTVVTRNVKDFKAFRVPLLNPFE